MEALKEMEWYYKQEEDKNSEYYVPLEEFKIVPMKNINNGYKLRDGIHLPMYIRNLSFVKTQEIRSDDVFVIGFPKSG